ncbi:Hypothetical protein SCF082_LOCUS14668 [Durusdinium trenchii]|uniref:Uncharacterized protein n=1 Tax=Durusdinium trenchii TaxID=1381693 RepID=A0ABP0JZQ7_9DINO
MHVHFNLLVFGLTYAWAEAPVRLAIYGACVESVNTEYNLQGRTASGAPFYKGFNSKLHIYFDPSCDGSTSDSRWIIDLLDGTPDRNQSQDLDDNLLCTHIAYISSTDTTKPPIGEFQWIMECPTGSQTVSLELAEVDRAGYQIPPAFFCAYNCGSDRGEVTRPGQCFVKSEVFATRGVSWGFLVTRMSEVPEGLSTNIPPLITEWETYSQGDMTWEGWFYVKAPPAERSMLIGTFGTNDDVTLYSSSSRRRHGAVWIESTGQIGMSTNAGTSSGYIDGPNLLDGKWHHVAAIWNQTAGGGSKVTKSFKFMHVRYSTIFGRQDMFAELTERILNATSIETNASKEDIWVTLSDEQIIGGEGRTKVSLAVNCDVKNADMTLARLVSSLTFDARMMGALFNTTLITNSFTGLPPVEDNVAIYDNEFPLIEYVGSGKLFVDSVEYVGRLTYSPDADNIADNGQFMIGGGHQGRPVDCEMARMRLWSLALTQEQLVELQSCDPLDVEQFIGGSYPHSLHASWDLNGNFSNNFGPLDNLTEHSAWEEQTGTGSNAVDGLNYPYWKNIVTGEAVQTFAQSMKHHLSRLNGGDFIRGGVCNFDACPSISPQNLCPLERSVRFMSIEECEAFASFNYCRLSGSTRNRPSMPHLDGCHIGPE